MSAAIAQFANAPPQTVVLGNLDDYVTEAEPLNPIDSYFRSMKSLIAYGNSSLLDDNNFIGRLLFLGLVSAAENYFRGALAGSIEICPHSQSHCSEKNINLGGLLWHGKKNFSRSAFEHASFTDSKFITSTSRDFINFNLQNAIFQGPLESFDKICQLRHGIAHADGQLPGRNAVKLEITKSNKPVEIIIRYRHIQEAASVINNLVILYNRELFVEMCKRWALQWRQRPDWDPTSEIARFNEIWLLFQSKIELRTRSKKSNLTRGKCLSILRTTYNLT